jgi:hypothetical protein
MECSGFMKGTHTLASPRLNNILVQHFAFSSSLSHGFLNCWRETSYKYIW